MNPSIIPDVDDAHEHPLTEKSDEHPKTDSERTLPEQVADRTKRQLEQPDTPGSNEK